MPRGSREASAKPGWMWLALLCCLVFFFPLVVWGQRRTPPIPGSWSRGIPVAEFSQRDECGLLPSPEGAWLAWSDRLDDKLALFLAAITPAGAVEAPRRLSLELDYRGRPQLVPSPAGPRVLFLARESPEAATRVFALALTREGNPIGEPLPLTPAGHDVKRFSASVTEGELWLAWEEREGGIWLASVDPASLAGAELWELDAAGGFPTLAVDEKLVHVVWLVELSSALCALKYAAIEKNVGDTSFTVVEVGRFAGGTGALVFPPALSLETGWVYALGGFEYRGGEKAGTSEVWVVSFPVRDPDALHTYSLSIPGAFPVECSEVIEGIEMSALGPWQRIRPTNLFMPRGVPGVRGHALVTLGAKLFSRNSESVQPVVVAFDEGEPVAWAPLAETRDFTYLVVIRQSDRGWHGAWLDMLGYGAYRLYYGTTAEAEKAALNRVGMDDVLHFLALAASGIVGGLAFIPLFLIAAVPGLVLLFVHYVFGGEESLRYRWPKTLLVLSLAPYLLLKILLASGFGGVPLARWMPQATAHLVGQVLPFVPSALAAVAILVYARRAGEPTLFPAWGTFIVVDILFTVLIVGPVFAGL